MGDLVARKRPGVEVGEGLPPPVETAWRIHDAQADWTGKVDAKAAFALTIHTALLAVAVTRVAKLEGWLEQSLFWVCVASLLVGAGLAANVVTPRLRAKGLREASKVNSIYFGHVRFLDPNELARRLRREDPLPQLSRQIVVMAQIAWTKHIRVGWSIWLGVFGGALLLLVSGLSAME
ncbi:Pycsar system effector family protein [Oerskovia enterophila]